MAGYKLATYQSTEGPRAGLVVDDKVFDAAKLTKRADYSTVLGILEDWRTARGLIEKAVAQPHQALGAGAAAFGDLLCGCELRRSRGRDECTPRQAAGPGPAHARPAVVALPQSHAFD